MYLAICQVNCWWSGAFVHVVRGFGFVVARFLIIPALQEGCLAVDQGGELGVSVDDLGRAPHHRLTRPLELAEGWTKCEIMPRKRLGDCSPSVVPERIHAVVVDH